MQFHQGPDSAKEAKVKVKKFVLLYLSTDIKNEE